MMGQNEDDGRERKKVRESSKSFEFDDVFAEKKEGEMKSENVGFILFFLWALKP